MPDEKRRLIYELLVEAKGLADSSRKTQAELNQMGSLAKKMGGIATGAFAGIAAALTVQGIGQAVDEVTKFNEQLRVLGITGRDAAAGFSDVQEIAFTTGQSIQAVAEAYQQAVEATQLLGGTQQDARELAEAFTRSMVAQGKDAGAAAHQLELLQFAIDRNGIKTKELTTLLRENETLQAAAQQALGLTTEGLLKMAEAGDIGREELARILDTFKEMTAEQDIALTFDRVAESVKTIGKAFVTAAADALGFNDAIDKTNKSALTDFLDLVRRIGQAVGGAIRVLFNLSQGIADIALALAQIAMGRNLKQVATDLVKNLQRDVDDALKGGRSILDAITGEAVRPPTPNETPIAGSGGGAGLQNALVDPMDEYIRQLQSAGELLEMQKKFHDDINKEIQQGLTAGERGLEQQIEANTERNTAIEDFSRQMAEQEAAIEPFKETLDSALTDVFTGATRSAKEFFATILRGFAQIFAQRAAMQITDSIMKGLGFGAAQGAAFAGGTLVPFAHGGVVTGPTLFGMSGGRTGIMGESGAEAVMPLRRMSDGKLGVSSSGPTSVTLINQTGVAATARVSRSSDRMSIVLEAAQLGAQLAEERMTRSMRNGYGPTATTLQGTYALRRRGGTR